MIVSGHLLYDQPVPAKGLLFIGDPHVSSIRPGRRNDVDWPEPILKKLEFIVDLANERELLPIGLGDLFDDSVEVSEALKMRVARILKKLWIPAIFNVGNHDIQHKTLSDDDSLAYLGFTDVIDVVKFAHPVCVAQVGEKRFGIGMTPYGQDIPTDVRGAFGDLAPDTVLWVTHHDIAFEGAYPGALRPFAIEGCRLVVNGHMHGTKPPVQVGAGERRTTWMNPGNINRQTVDMMDHVPCVFILDESGRFEPIPLPHGNHVFDLTGRLVDPAARSAVADDIESAFVAMLKAESGTDLARSMDGSLVREDIEALFESRKTPADVKAVVNSLWQEAVERRRSAA